MSNSKTLIHDVKYTKLKQIVDNRGAVFHYLKSIDDSYKGFAEAYFSKINYDFVKGWKLHKKTQQNLCVPYGVVKIVLYDERTDSKSYGIIQEIILDDNENYHLLSIPPQIWYSFKALSSPFAVLSNIINHQHDPMESENKDLDNNSIPYDWT